MKNFSDRMEAAALWFAFLIFRMIGADNASALGGWIGRTIGPSLAASRKARANLEKSIPDADADAVIRDMWDNLGRVIAEYPHLKTIIDKRTDISGLEHFERVKDKFIVIGGHLANWELLPVSMNYRLNAPITGVYREPNNAYAAAILDRCRNFGDKGSYVPKSSAGTRALVKAMQVDGRVGILIDQKYNEGEPVEFFGRPAMTSTAVAQLALKYDAPILPLQVVRDKNRFHIILHPPLAVDGLDEAGIMLAANRLLEGWIRQKPGQWLWLHRRWDSKALQQLHN